MADYEELKDTVTTLITQTGEEVPPGQPGETRQIIAFTLNLLDGDTETTCIQCVTGSRDKEGKYHISQNISLASYDTAERADAVKNECWQAIKDGEETYTFPQK